MYRNKKYEKKKTKLSFFLLTNQHLFKNMRDIYLGFYIKSEFFIL